MLTLYVFMGVFMMIICEKYREDASTPESPYPVQTGEELMKKFMFWPLYYPFPLKNPAANSSEKE